MTLADELRDETLCVRVINVKDGNYWKCPVCDGENKHKDTCVIERAAVALSSLRGVTVPEELLQQLRSHILFSNYTMHNFERRRAAVELANRITTFLPQAAAPGAKGEI
jgi:hypothetical protein